MLHFIVDPDIYAGVLKILSTLLMKLIVQNVNDTQKEILNKLGIIEVSEVRWYLALVRVWNKLRGLNQNNIFGILRRTCWP